MAFNCDKCGICCRNMGGISELSDYNGGTGVCIHLRQDNLCAIYNKRPIWCKVDEYYDQVLSSTMTREEWYRLNEKACLELKRCSNTE